MPSGQEDSSQLAFFSPLGGSLASLFHTKCNTTDLLFLCVMTTPGVSYVTSCVSFLEILGSKDKKVGRIFFSPPLPRQDARRCLEDFWVGKGDSWAHRTLAVNLRPCRGHICTFKQHPKILIDLFFFFKHPWSSTWKLTEVVYNTGNLAQDYLKSCLLNPCFCLTKISLVITPAPPSPFFFSSCLSSLSPSLSQKKKEI